MSGKYPLQDILKVRTMKQDKALDALNKQKRLLKAAEKKIKKQKWRIERFTEWLPAEEDKRYALIMGKEVQKSDVNAVKERIDSHRNRLAQHHDRLDRFKEEKKEVKKNLEAAREAYQQLTFNIEKLLLHKEDWTKDYQKELMDKQEKEAEDNPLRKKEF